MQDKNREISPLGREEGYGGKDLEKRCATHIKITGKSYMVFTAYSKYRICHTELYDISMQFYY